MKTYKVLIVDDEEPARGLLKMHVSKIKELELVGACENAIDAKKMLANHAIDILLLDIQMDDITGLDLLRMLKHQPTTILTTAYSEYALESYELDVIDYLVKPITFERFFKAISKAMEFSEFRTNTNSAKPLVESLPVLSYMFIKVEQQMVKVAFKDLLYLESFGEYVKVHTTKGMQLTLKSLSYFEERLPKHQICRIHRSFMVNLDKIDIIEDNGVKIGEKRISISRRLKDDFLEAIKGRGIF